MGNRPTKINWLEAKADYLSGQMSYAKIAEKYGISTNAVKNRAKADDWPKLAQNLAAEAESRMVEQVTSELVEFKITSRNLSTKTLKILDLKATMTNNFMVEQIQKNSKVHPNKIYPDSALRDFTQAQKTLLETGLLGRDQPTTISVQNAQIAMAAVNLTAEQWKEITDATSRIGNPTYTH